MKAGVLLERAAKYQQKIEKALEPINKALSVLLDEHEASIQYQYSDGWVVLFGGDQNAVISSTEIDYLLSLNRDDALDFLRARSI